MEVLFSENRRENPLLSKKCFIRLERNLIKTGKRPCFRILAYSKFGFYSPTGADTFTDPKNSPLLEVSQEARTDPINVTTGNTNTFMSA